MDFAMTQLLMFFVIHEKLNGSQSIDKLHASNFHVNIFTIRWVFRLEFRFVKEAGRQAGRQAFNREYWKGKQPIFFGYIFPVEIKFNIFSRTIAILNTNSN